MRYAFYKPMTYNYIALLFVVCALSESLTSNGGVTLSIAG